MARVRVLIETAAGDIDVQEDFPEFESMGVRPSAKSALPALERVLARVRAAVEAEA